MSVRTVSILLLSALCLTIPQHTDVMQFMLSDYEFRTSTQHPTNIITRTVDPATTEPQYQNPQLERLRRENIRLNSMITELRVERDEYRAFYRENVDLHIKSVRNILNILEYVEEHILEYHNITAPSEFTEFHEKIRQQHADMEKQ